ncbi:MAG: ribbon-helix-helix domain-containing protein [Alphaproteobacteria bacterium]
MPRESQLKKRSVRIAGHETSITLEDEFWDVLRSIAQEQDISINQLISNIDEGRKSNLSSALRVYILQYLQNKLAQ